VARLCVRAYMGGGGVYILHFRTIWHPDQDLPLLMAYCGRTAWLHYLVTRPTVCSEVCMHNNCSWVALSSTEYISNILWSWGWTEEAQERAMSHLWFRLPESKLNCQDLLLESLWGNTPWEWDMDETGPGRAARTALILATQRLQVAPQQFP
jgi:hypothetical protein